MSSEQVRGLFGRFIPRGRVVMTGSTLRVGRRTKRTTTWFAGEVGAKAAGGLGGAMIERSRTGYGSRYTEDGDKPARGVKR